MIRRSKSILDNIVIRINNALKLYLHGNIASYIKIRMIYMQIHKINQLYLISVLITRQ
jgi:hypothetical protein